MDRTAMNVSGLDLWYYLMNGEWCAVMLVVPSAWRVGDGGDGGGERDDTGKLHGGDTWRLETLNDVLAGHWRI